MSDRVEVFSYNPLLDSQLFVTKCSFSDERFELNDKIIRSVEEKNFNENHVWISCKKCVIKTMILDLNSLVDELDTEDSTEKSKQSF